MENDKEVVLKKCESCGDPTQRSDICDECALVAEYLNSRRPKSAPRPLTRKAEV